jgi:hypothetical protein
MAFRTRRNATWTAGGNPAMYSSIVRGDARFVGIGAPS